jgi:selenium metabolism protein YedF
MKALDCRGLACPGPVIQVKKALEEPLSGGTITVQVDSEASRDNVERFVKSRGYSILVDGDGESGWTITIATSETGSGRREKGEGRRDLSTLTPIKPPVVLIASDTLGTGDDKLGRILMEGFVNTLAEQDHVPDKLLLMNGGVRFATEGSPVLASLKTLTDRGCEILVCGTCLEFFGLKDKLSAGMVSNMYDIQGAMFTASKVVSP